MPPNRSRKAHFACQPQLTSAQRPQRCKMDEGDFDRPATGCQQLPKSLASCRSEEGPAYDDWGSEQPQAQSRSLQQRHPQQPAVMKGFTSGRVGSRNCVCGGDGGGGGGQQRGSAKTSVPQAVYIPVTKVASSVTCAASSDQATSSSCSEPPLPPIDTRPQERPNLRQRQQQQQHHADTLPRALADDYEELDSIADENPDDGADDPSACPEDNTEAATAAVSVNSAATAAYGSLAIANNSQGTCGGGDNRRLPQSNHSKQQQQQQQHQQQLLRGISFCYSEEKRFSGVEGADPASYRRGSATKPPQRLSSPAVAATGKSSRQKQKQQQLLQLLQHQQQQQKQMMQLRNQQLQQQQHNSGKQSQVSVIHQLVIQFVGCGECTACGLGQTAGHLGTQVVRIPVGGCSGGRQPTLPAAAHGGGGGNTGSSSSGGVGTGGDF